ncbi:MAG: LPS export ABC transporter permease LptG [Pseudomonadota bacterium]
MTRLPANAVVSRYLALQFVRWIGGVFILGTAIIFIADSIELIRRTVDKPGFSAADAVLASLLKTPALTEEFLPFAVLFGAIGAFLNLNRRLELAVLRAAGVSVWQFVAPALLVAAAIGVFATTVYNPLSAAARERSDVLSAKLLGKEARLLTGGGQAVWFRQEGEGISSIMHAAAAGSDGLTLYAVEAHLIDRDGAFIGRVEAATAALGDGAWTLTDAMVFDSAGVRTEALQYRVPTRLSPIQVREAVARPDAIPFWRLPSAVRLAQSAGLPAHRFALQHQMLIARPMLLAAMVLIAACVSLRMVRLGGVARAATGGVVAGFGLFIASAVASDLGEAGAVAPVLAAWLPGMTAAFIGATVLLHTEDG